MKILERPLSLTQRAYEAIRQAIRSGELSHGETYSEGEISTRMGISRTPVREAIIELQREGLLEVKPQRGFSLRTIDQAEREELFALRKALEQLTVKRLAQRADPSDVERLRDIIAEQEKVVEDGVAFMTWDEQFHLLMPQLMDLKRTHKMLSMLRGAMWLIGTSALGSEERARQVLEEHAAIAAAIAGGDPDGAAAAVCNHLERTAATIEKVDSPLTDH